MLSLIISIEYEFFADRALIKFIGLYTADIPTAVGLCLDGSLSPFGLKKYAKIKYRASDIILAILGFVIVSALYYLGNFYGFVSEPYL